MRIAIASGKGGTGKTTVTVNLARYLSLNNQSVQLVDCDVEEPNSHFFLGIEFGPEEKQYVPVPAVNPEKCLGEECKKCVRECRFKALIWMADQMMVFPELCHSCRLCNLVCPTGAIEDSQRKIGILRRGQKDRLELLGGLLKIGEAMAPPLIKKVKQAIRPDPESTVILDCPPGTSCPVIEAIQEADYVLLVTEPTPFGLYDLQLATGLMRKLNFPFGVVINREGMGGEKKLEAYLAKENIPVLARIPHSTRAARAYSRGELLVESLPEMRDIYARLWEELLKTTGAEAGQ